MEKSGTPFPIFPRKARKLPNTNFRFTEAGERLPFWTMEASFPRLFWVLSVACPDSLICRSRAAGTDTDPVPPFLLGQQEGLVGFLYDLLRGLGRFAGEEGGNSRTERYGKDGTGALEVVFLDTSFQAADDFISG